MVFNSSFGVRPKDFLVKCLHQLARHGQSERLETFVSALSMGGFSTQNFQMIRSRVDKLQQEDIRFSIFVGIWST